LLACVFPLNILFSPWRPSELPLQHCRAKPSRHAGHDFISDFVPCVRSRASPHSHPNTLPPLRALPLLPKSSAVALRFSPTQMPRCAIFKADPPFSARVLVFAVLQVRQVSDSNAILQIVESIF
jgi:hypothetical protein